MSLVRSLRRSSMTAISMFAAVAAYAQSLAPSTTAADDPALTRKQFEILPWKAENPAAKEALSAAKAAQDAAAEAKAAAEAAKAAAAAAPATAIAPAPDPVAKPADKSPDVPTPAVTAAIPAPASDSTSSLAAGAASAAPDAPALTTPDAGTKAGAQIPAKTYFGAAKTGAPLPPRAFGSYAKGCLAGGVALKTETDAWQAMRLSRNRNWGHPKLIELLDRFANDMKTKEKWPGLLIGDLAQPRGGPMLTGHKSHQLGLDADVWFKPMPKKVMTRAERETLEPLLLAEDNGTTVITKNWDEGFVRLIRRAASYPEVERIFVHPAIKREFCKVKDTDRSWLKKVRPMWLHNYHFHIRMSCPAGSPACEHQKPPPNDDDGCGKEITDWIAMVSRPPKPEPKPTIPVKPAPPPPVLTLEKLPPQCREVLTAGEPQEKHPPLPVVAKPAAKAGAKTAAATKAAKKANSDYSGPSP